MPSKLHPQQMMASARNGLAISRGHAEGHVEATWIEAGGLMNEACRRNDVAARLRCLNVACKLRGKARTN